MKIIKWIILASVVLFLAVVAAAFVIVKSYDFNSLKPEIEAAVYDATGRKLEMKGDIKVKLGFTPNIIINDVTFSNASWAGDKVMASIGSFELEVGLLSLLKGVVEVKRLILSEPEILLQVNKKGLSNLEFTPPTVDAVTQDDIKVKAAADVVEKKAGDSKKELSVPGIVINIIVIRNGHVSYRDQRSGAVHEAALDELTVKMPSSDEAVKVRMLGSYNSMPFDVSGSLGSLRSILDPELSWSMDILVNTLGAKVALKGDVKNPLAIRGINAELSVDVKELDTLWRSLGMEMGVSGPLKLKAHVNDSEENVFLLKDLIVTQGESDIRGHGTIDLSKTKPFIFAAIDSDYLNLKPWLKVDKDKKKGKEHDGSDTKNAKGDKKKLLPSSELPFASLKSVDARVIVKAVRLVHPFLILDNVKVILKLRDGKLDINLGRFGAYGGSMQGNLSVDSNPQPPEIVVDFQATGVEVSSYLKEQGLSESVSGRVDVDVGLKGAGTSVAKIFSTINGNYFFTMGEGRIDNSKLGFLDESSLLTFLQLLNPSINMKKEPYTAINCVASGFEFTDGLAETNALLIDTSLMTVAGKGWVDFKTEKIRMSLSPTPKSAVDPSLYGVSLSQLAKPVRLGGTLSKPKLEMDPEQAAKILLKALGGESYLKTFEGLSTLGDGNGQQNPCVTALREGSSVTGEKGESGEKEEKIEKKILKDIPIEIPEEIEETLKDVEKGLKKIFGK